MTSPLSAMAPVWCPATSVTSVRWEVVSMMLQISIGTRDMESSRPWAALLVSSAPEELVGFPNEAALLRGTSGNTIAGGTISYAGIVEEKLP